MSNIPMPRPIANGKGVFLLEGSDISVRLEWRGTLQDAVQAIARAVGPRARIHLCGRPSSSPVRCFYLDVQGAGGYAESVDITVSVSPYLNPAEPDTDFQVNRIQPGSDHGLGFANEFDVLCFAAYLLSGLGPDTALQIDLPFALASASDRSPPSGSSGTR